ncbi:MAG TPA: hypothetical protein VEB22_10215 [Phycisphaerales bacterium]|nr:hypothetical protein [Phycisphaerales bacterium]
MTDDDLPPLNNTAARLGRHGAAIAFLTIPAAAALGLACLGLPPGDSPQAAIATLLYTWFTAGAVAVAFLLAAIGFGWPVARLLAASQRDRLCLQPAAGLAAMLFIDHLVGVAGGFSGSTGRIGAIGVCVAGIALLLVQLAGLLKTRPRMPKEPWTALLACASVGLLLVAACNPPGILWRSEAGGFDALSYHLPLAQEWAAGTCIWPLQHNVYSYLPSYAEAGFTLVAALCGGSLVLNDGIGALACQFIHVEQTLIAAFTVGTLAAALARRCGISGHGAKLGGGLAFAAVLGVPWTVVVGSLAYNEMAALALAAGAMLAAVSDGSPWRRGLGCGLLLGAATACKPTFFFMAGPTAALLLLATLIPARQLVKPLLAGALGGLIMLAPPLARNWAACGNPVFPLSTALGRADWTPEQAERFRKAHGRDGTVAEQTRRLFSPNAEPNAFNGEPRGIMHSQWAMMFPVCGGALLLLLLRRETHRTAAVLAGGVLGGFVFWIVATHGQSRFLIPLLPNLACALGVLAAWLVGEGAALSPARRLSLIFVAVVPLMASAAAVRLFLTENGARPNALLTRGVSFLTGESEREQFDSLPLSERNDLERNAPMAVYTAVTLREPGDKLFMLGDATPLYYIVPVVYNTTWDRSVLGRAMAAHPDEPAAWTRAVRATGATHILINEAEIARYRGTYGFDEAITVDRLETWKFTLGDPVRAWEAGGRARVFLFEVPAERPLTPPAPSPVPRNGA